MSEISVLSNYYNSVVDVTDKINDSIIALKKRKYFRTSSRDNIKYPDLSQDDFRAANDYLLYFLKYLLDLSKKDKSDLDYLPNVIANDVQQKILNTFQFDSEIHSLINNIILGKELDINQFNLLDKIVFILDNERTILFRKLRAARG